jgi:hypothetical protein
MKVWPAVAGLLGLLASSTVYAQDPAAFYKGRNIDLIVASTPGGGFDAYARVMARHWGRHIPGNPALVVRNLPGAGGLTSTLYLHDVAPKDGTAILANQPGPLAEPVLGDKAKTNFDPLRFGHIGSVASFTTLCLIRQDSKAKSFEDWQRMEVTFGTDQPNSTMHDHTVLFTNLAGAKTKIVSGYPGSNGLVLALQRGEIEGLCGYAWSSLFARSPELISKNIARMVVQYGIEPHKEVREERGGQAGARAGRRAAGVRPALHDDAGRAEGPPPGVATVVRRHHAGQGVPGRHGEGQARRDPDDGREGRGTGRQGARLSQGRAGQGQGRTADQAVRCRAGKTRRLAASWQVGRRERRHGSSARARSAPLTCPTTYRGFIAAAICAAAPS